MVFLVIGLERLGQEWVDHCTYMHSVPQVPTPSSHAYLCCHYISGVQHFLIFFRAILLYPLLLLTFFKPLFLSVHSSLFFVFQRSFRVSYPHPTYYILFIDVYTFLFLLHPYFSVFLSGTDYKHMFLICLLKS